MSGSRPRILMVGPWPPTRGGVTTFMRNVAASPLKDRYEFVPFTTSRPGKRNVRADNYGYRAVFRGGLKRVALGILITLWHLAIYPVVLALRRPDVVQIQASDFQAFWEASLYVRMARLLRFPVVLRIGGSFDRFWEASGRLARAAIRQTLDLADVLLVQSEYWRRYVARLGHSGATVILHNFVPESLLEKRTTPVPAVPRFLLYCGEVPTLKGAYVLFDALRALDVRGVRVDVALVAVTAPLREEIRAAGLEGPVRALDFLSHEETLDALRRTEVFLQISSSEGFPNMLLEAMALGCAAIATPVGAVPEVVGADGECAFLVPTGDAAALAGRMARLAADRGLLARMAAAAQARVAARFTEAKVTPVLERAYRIAIEEQRESRQPARRRVAR